PVTQLRSLPAHFSHYCYAAHRHLHSFPTRRSSDLSEICRTTSTSSADPLCASAVSTSPAVSSAPGAYSIWPKTSPASRAGTSWKDRKSTRLNSSHVKISYAVFCLKKKKNTNSSQTQ